MTRRKIDIQSPETDSDAASAKPTTAKELLAVIRKNGLVGMWKGREDIGDSSKFARKLRRQVLRRKVGQ
jgi:hypothetical protein